MPCSDLKWNLHPEALARRVDEAVGVAAEAVHLPVVLRQAAVGEQDRHLVQALRRQRPEVPHRRGAAQIGLGIALLRVDEVAELEGIADEEHRRVVADEVPVAFLGVELDGEAAHVALGIGRPALAGDGGEAQKQLRLLADRGEQLGARVARDVLGDSERAVGGRALGVHHALGNPLAVEVRHLLDEVVVGEQHRAAHARGEAVLVVGDGIAAGGGQDGRVGWR